MTKRLILIALFLAAAAMACEAGAQPGPGTPFPTPQDSVFESGRTAYGFFPVAPETSVQSVIDTIQGIGKHGDVLLLQRNIPWGDFVKGRDVGSQEIVDLRNIVGLAAQNGLEPIFVVDPLNGLNRREFLGLPAGWPADFANPDVRAAFTNYSLRLVREFHPRYLGLASEINTYADAHPQDFSNYLSLYREVYEAVKAESPATQVFVTFQWEDLNNMFGQAEPGHGAGRINWEQVEIFEPELDLWVISSYPFAAFKTGRDIPGDYYTPLLGRTSKPLAVAEGGFISRDVGPFHGRPEDQVAYLEAIHDQIGGRLSFWIYLLYTDFNLEAFARAMRERGDSTADINTLGLFASVGLSESNGTPKPGLAVWDGFQGTP